MRLLSALVLCAVPALAGFRAGAAKAVITPDLARFHPVYIAGFGQNRVATGVHDDLYARCVAFQTGPKPLVVCAVDSIGLFLDDTRKVREIVTRRLPELAPDVVVASTHDHEAPDTMGLWGPAPGQSGINEEYNALLVRRTAETAIAAVRALTPATARLAGVADRELFGFIHDNRPPVVRDAGLVLLALAREDGRPIATIVNWANHPETLGSSNTLLTADYAGPLCARLEERRGGLAVLWNGAVGGMQSPLGAAIKDPATGKPAADSSFRKAEIIGRRVADLADGALRTARPAGIGQVVFRETQVPIPVENPAFRMAREAGVFKGRKADVDTVTSTPVGLIHMLKGSEPVLEIALVPGELYPELSTGGVVRYPGADYPDAPVEPALKSLMRAPWRMLIGLAGDEIGYIIPKAEWDRKPPYLQDARKTWYGEVNSVGPEAAPAIAEAFRALLAGR